MTCFPLVPSFNSAGEAWDAIVPVSYVNPQNGQILNASVEIDTGAAYSLAPASLASILGLQLSSGPTLQLQGVQGQGFQAYLHSLTIEVGGTAFRGVLVAIANVETVPFLLGRTNFWDFASIRIDDLNRQVCIDPLPGAGSVVAQTSPLAVGVVFLGLGAAALITFLLVRK